MLNQFMLSVGASIDNILNLEKDYPNMTTIKLEQNYRSTQNIVEAANSIIAKNKNQLKKTVFTESTILRSRRHDIHAPALYLQVSRFDKQSPAL